MDFRTPDKWEKLSLDEKLNSLHNDVVSLFGIAEDFTHQNQVVSESFYRLQGQIDGITKTLKNLQRNGRESEMIHHDTLIRSLHMSDI